MSEPKRYDNFQYETAEGEYVRYEDYAALKAEIERLDNLIISGGAVIPDASVYTE